MPHRAVSRAPLAALLLASLALPAGCASASSSDGAAVDTSDRPALPESGVKAGWMSYKAATREGQVQSLTLLSEGSREGRLIAQGRASMAGGKVVEDATAADLLLAFDQAGFGRFAVRVNPNDAPPGALGSVWIDRGAGFESLFLVPGARQSPETAELPDVYDALKKLIFTIHQATPGSMVTTGQGWSGDDLMRQKIGEGDR